MLFKSRKRLLKTPKASDEQIAYYDALVRQHDNPAVSVGWSTTYAQTLRFEVLSMVGDLNQASVLDCGCGRGDLLQYLSNEGISCDYLGVDASAHMIQEARKCYPDHTFKHVDFMDDDFRVSVDYVLASGAMSYRVEDPKAYLEETIFKLFSMAKRGLAFNLLSQVKDGSSRFMAFDPVQVFDLCRQWTPYVSVQHHYLPNDFTVYLYSELA